MKQTRYPSVLHAYLATMEHQRGEINRPKVLDCGAGTGSGEIPPLGLFSEAGYDCLGIDISPERLDNARASTRELSLEMKFMQADMRRLPFESDSFDFIYEYNSLPHLTKADTGIAIAEMRRVLRKGGLCFLGFMSLDSWPILGRRIGDGEFSLVEGSETVTHSAFADDEPDRYFGDWTLVQKEKNRRWYREWSERQNLEDWMRWYDPAHSDLSESEWNALYSGRIEKSNNSQLFYAVRKP